MPFEVRIPFYYVVVLDCVRLPEDARSACLSLPFARFERFRSGEFYPTFAAKIRITSETLLSLSLTVSSSWFRKVLLFW